jgi:hypothetical protein
MGAFNILFPVFAGGLAWGGLWLRDSQLERMLPWKRRN